MTTTELLPTKHHAIKILGSPWTILIAIIIGLYLGIFHVDLAKDTKIIGNLYLSLFKMCVFPILTSGIMISLGKLMRRKDAASYIQRILIIFPLSLLALGFVTTLIGLISAPGKNLNSKSLEALGVLVNKSGIDIELPLTGNLPPIKENTVFQDFVLNLVPDNIFNALTEGKTLQVLFFSMVFGIALGLTSRRTSNVFFVYLDAIYKAFSNVINWLKYLLPFGLCSLIAAQIANVGVATLMPMLKFILISIFTFIIVFFANTLLIAWRTRMSFFAVLDGLREPTILSLATSSSLACLPSSIESMEKSLGFEEESINLLLPLSITICRYGSVVYFALASVFVAQLYNHALGIADVLVIIIGSIFAGMATSGVTGVLTLTMLGIVLSPLGLPLDAVLVLFIAVDPIMDPFRTLTIVHSGIAATSLIADMSVDRSPSQRFQKGMALPEEMN